MTACVFSHQPRLPVVPIHSANRPRLPALVSPAQIELQEEEQKEMLEQRKRDDAAQKALEGDVGAKEEKSEEEETPETK